MDTWINGFEMSQTCYDKQAKEIVHITNGKCTLDHSSPEAYKVAHSNNGCIFSPHEAAALRVVGTTKNGDPIIAFTYRAVIADQLTPLKTNDGDPFEIMNKVRKSRNAGRV